MTLSVAQEIATYLAAQSLPTTLIYNDGDSNTNNLFVGTLPDAPDLAVAIYERPGMAPVSALTGGSQTELKFDRPVIQIRVRAGASQGGYDTGNALVQGIFEALQGIVETVLNPPTGQLFHLIEAMGSPMWLGRGANIDPRQRPNWSQTFLAWFENDAR